MRHAGVMEPRWVDDASKLAALIEDLRDEPRYALDTEFHGERTYWPRLALVQVAWPGGIALIDPFAVDFEPFAVRPFGAVSDFEENAIIAISVPPRASAKTAMAI